MFHYFDVLVLVLRSFEEYLDSVVKFVAELTDDLICLWIAVIHLLLSIVELG